MNNLMEELYKNNEIQKIQKIQFILDKIKKDVDDIQMLFNYACYLKILDIVIYLLEYDKTINIHIENDRVFKIACKEGSIELVDILIKHGEQNNDRINIQSEYCNVLKNAVHSGYITIVKYLINYGERINEKYDLYDLFNNYRFYELLILNETYGYIEFSIISSDEIIKYLIYLDRHNYKFIISQESSVVMWGASAIHKYVNKNINKPLYLDKYIYNNNIELSFDCHCKVTDAIFNNYILYI